MISGMIELIISNKKTKLTLEDYNGILSINDDFFNQLFDKNNIQHETVDHSTVYLTISSQKDTLEIDDLSMFEQIVINTFSNTTAEFGILSVKGISLSVFNLIIDTFRTCCGSAFIGNSKINDYDFSMDYRENNKHNNDAQELKLVNVKINRIGIHQSIRSIEIKDSEIDKLHYNSDTDTSKLVTEHVVFSETTRINELKINSKVMELNIQDSKVRRFYFGRITTINQVSLNNSTVEKVYLCQESKIINKNYDAWALLFNSSIYDNNDLLYAKAGYMTNYLLNQNRKGLLRMMSSTFLRWSIGYGYKPARALYFSMINISIFALLFMISDYWFELGQVFNDINKTPFNILIKRFLNNYWERWYLSGTAFTTTGFGDVAPASFGTRILSVIDSLIGVSVLSLFIYSLTKRYGEKSK